MRDYFWRETLDAYSLRERVNLYGGPIVMGSILTLVGGMTMYAQTHSATKTLVGGAIGILFGICTIPFGRAFGEDCADELREERIYRELISGLDKRTAKLEAELTRRESILK